MRQHQGHQRELSDAVPHPLAVPRKPQPATLELPVGRAQAEPVRVREAGTSPRTLVRPRLLILCRNWRRRYQIRQRARHPFTCAHATSLRATNCCTYSAGNKVQGNSTGSISTSVCDDTTIRLHRDGASGLLKLKVIQQVTCYVSDLVHI